MKRIQLTKNRTRNLLAQLTIGALCCSPVSSAHAALTQWSTNASGVFTNPFNWTSGVPDDNDIALFNSGFVAYEVVFPAGSIFDPPPNFSIYDLIVATNEVSFVYPSFSLNPPSLSVLDPNLSIVIGESSGDVSILNMAIGQLSGANASIGALAGANGTLNVGRTFSLSGSLRVGDSGTGTLNVTGGGRVESHDADIGFLLSHGAATVAGVGSAWTISEGLVVGRLGGGALAINSGGSVANGDGEIASGGNSLSFVTVTGVGSTWTNRGNLTVGDEGTGNLSITDGGAVSSNAATIAADPFNTFHQSTVSVIGSGSNWTIGGPLTVGFTGELTVADGGSVSNTEGFIGTAFSSFSPGEVTVTGANSAWTMERLSIGNGSGGSGRVSILPGGTVSVAQGILLYTQGGLFLQGGALDAQAVTFPDSGGQFQFQSGTLHVGTFNGNLLNQGGTLAPGHSAGATTINGNYTQQAGAALQFEIGGASAGGTHDLVSVTGNVILGGQLQLAMLNGFVPSPADTFTVFNAAGSLSGAFTNVATGQRLPTTDGLGSFVVNYGPASAFNQNQIVLSAFHPALSADFDEDGDVDGDDLVQWRGDFGVNGLSDADDDGDSDGDDFLAWQRQFGSGPPSTAASTLVPEPTTALLLLLAAAGLGRTAESKRKVPATHLHMTLVINRPI